MSDRPRFRWVVPLFIGVSVGGAVGVLVTFVGMTYSGRAGVGTFVAEQFQVGQVLAATDPNLVVQTDRPAEVGTSGRRGMRSGFQRRIVVRGSLSEGANRGTVVNTLLSQIQAEFGRHGASQSGSGSSSQSNADRLHQTGELEFFLNDGRRLRVDYVLTIDGRDVSLTLYLFEAR